MSKLDHYLQNKRTALAARRERWLAEPEVKASVVNVHARVAGNSGIREVRIRDFQLLSDSAEDFGGNDLAASGVELQLGVLAACLVHTGLIQAAKRNLSVEDIQVEVAADQHPLGGEAGTPYADIPNYPTAIRYTLKVYSDESSQAIAGLHDGIREKCPILRLLAHAGEIAGELQQFRSQAEASA